MSVTHVSCAWLARAWSRSKEGKKIFSKTDLLIKYGWIFEWNPTVYKKAETHNMGVGFYCGQVLDPHGATIKTRWADNDIDPVPRQMCRLAPAVGEVFEYHGDKYEVLFYGSGLKSKEPGKDETQKGAGVKILPRESAKAKKISAREESVRLEKMSNEIIGTNYEKGVALKRASNQKMMQALGLESFKPIPKKKLRTKKQTSKPSLEDPDYKPHSSDDSSAEAKATVKKVKKKGL